MSKKVGVIVASCVTLVAILGVVLYFVLFFNQSYVGKVTDSLKNPVEGVSVTDGRNVVKTDGEGNFLLKGNRKTRFITITVPTGYKSQSFYQKVDKNTDNYNFTLVKDENNYDNHSFLQISDTEIGAKGAGDWVDYTKKLVETTKPAFLIHTGDLCYTDGVKQHIKEVNTENMGVDVRYIIGNHDYVDGKYGEELFESIYGPLWYSFEVGNVHYVVTPIQYGDKKSGYSKNDRWRWLKNDLENTDKNKEIVIFNHTNSQDNGLNDYTVKFGRNELDLKAYNLKAWIFGHYHYNFVNNNDGVLDISTARPDCGGIDQSVSAVRQIFVDSKGEITTKLHYYNCDEANAVTPENLFSTKLEGNVLFSDTLKVGNNILVGTIDDNFPNNSAVYCLNSENGEINWKYKTENSVKNNVLVVNNSVISQDCEGNVYSIDLKTGKKLWNVKLKLKSPQYTSVGIIADDKYVYVGSGTEVFALEIGSGKQVWNTNQKSGECSSASFQLSNNKLIVSSQWNSLYALDTTTGEMLWEAKNDKIRLRSSTPNCLNNGNIFLASADTVALLNGNNGKIIFETQLKKYNFDVASKPLVVDNVAYVATAENGIIAFDMNNKKELWNFKTRQSLIYTSPYTSGNAKTVESSIVDDSENIVFGASDGYVYFVNKKTGKLVKEVNFGSPIFSTLAKDENSVIISDFFGRITKISK